MSSLQTLYILTTYIHQHIVKHTHHMYYVNVVDCGQYIIDEPYIREYAGSELIHSPAPPHMCLQPSSSIFIKSGPWRCFYFTLIFRDGVKLGIM